MQGKAGPGSGADSGSGSGSGQAQGRACGGEQSCGSVRHWAVRCGAAGRSGGWSAVRRALSPTGSAAQSGGRQTAAWA